MTMVVLTTRRTILTAFVFVMGYAGLTIVVNAQEAAPVTCIAQGRDYVVGDIACIPACHGNQRLAKCEQTGNGGVTWTPISDSCPQAMQFDTSPQMSVALVGSDMNATLITGLPELLKF